ncbi:MAG TPA: transposase [Pyrinomonadaceae bacterium]|nr:transposase [Pyrinomonadaceae bacterium]
MSDAERQQALELRKARKLPWHTPPHLDLTVEKQYLVSSSCYEHAPVIGKHPQRMTDCEAEVLRICSEACTRIYAWCILPNHFHVFVRTERIKELRAALAQFHGRTAFTWNREDNQRGRKVWYNCFERDMKSERHFWATLNYVHNNAVHHGYVKRWEDWPWSSARQYLEKVGRETARRIWLEYPILDYGKKWDI